MALQTTDVWAVLQLCDARLEEERDQQRQLDCAGWHERLDRNRDFDLDSARVCGGEQAQRKAAATRDREAEHEGDCTRDHGGFGRGFGVVEYNWCILRG